MHKNEIDIITLGCSKNLVDTERLMWQLAQVGFTCVHDSLEPQGEIVVINTCGFIGDAKEESINTILQFAKRKKQRKLKRIYVMGCLAERYLKDLEKELPEVDAFFGKFDFMKLVAELKSFRDADNIKSDVQDVTSYKRIITTPQHYAYIKIAEGCNRYCSYCAIPLITGHYSSRTIEDIVDETQWLVGRGVKEFQIIAQDLTYYGTDLYGESRIAELIGRISDIQGVEWIRLHYAYPAKFPMDLLPVMRERKNVCKYLDIALQHSTDRMLGLMRRHISKDEQTTLIQEIRRQVPGIHIRTTIMVGHPGETKQDFEELKQWISQMRFERLGAFTYSAEEGTYAGIHYEDNIPQEIKNKRLDSLMTLQEQIAADINALKIGLTMLVIIDREEEDFYIGRTEFDSPEVDGEVLINKTHRLTIGYMYHVRITDADTFDLYAELLTE